MKSNTAKLFKKRKGHLDSRVNLDYIRNGVAVIPCNVSDYNDVISSYSVKGFENLNPNFVDFLNDNAELIPGKYPLVLNIIGDNLSQEEQKTIEEVILEETAYNLGVVEKREIRSIHASFLMVFALLFSGLLLWVTRSIADEPRELIYIMFWFLGEALCDFLFMSGHDLREERRQAGRLASIKVIFSEKYDDPNYANIDVDNLYSEIEKEVYETIQEE